MLDTSDQVAALQVLLSMEIISSSVWSLKSPWQQMAHCQAMVFVYCLYGQGHIVRHGQGHNVRPWCTACMDKGTMSGHGVLLVWTRAQCQAMVYCLYGQGYNVRPWCTACMDKGTLSGHGVLLVWTRAHCQAMVYCLYGQGHIVSPWCTACMDKGTLLVHGPRKITDVRFKKMKTKHIPVVPLKVNGSGRFTNLLHFTQREALGRFS